MRDQKQRNEFAEKCLVEANALRLAGETERARKKLKDLLSVWPENQVANQAMVFLSDPLIQNEKRLSSLQRVIRQAPRNFEIWRTYIFELRMAGQKVKARKEIKKAKVSALERKALKQIADGRRATTEDMVRLINDGAAALAWTTGIARLKKFPKDYRLLNLLGVASLAEDDTQNAENVLRQSLAVAPEFEAARANLGFALLRQSRAGEVIDLLEEAAQNKTASLEIRVNLANAYWMAGHLQSANTLSETLVLEAPNDTEVIEIRARTLIALDQPADAISLLESLTQTKDLGLEALMASAIKASSGQDKAIAYLNMLGPLSPQTDFKIAAQLAEWGQLAQATARVRNLAQKNSQDIAAFRMIGLLSKWTRSDPLIGKMKETIDAGELSAVKQGTLGLVYAKAMKDIRKYSAAMDALINANATLRSLANYNVAIDEAQMFEIAQCWNSSSISLMATDFETPRPVFIVGLPRSGSTLLETILSCHEDVEFLGESPIAFSAASKARLQPKSDTVLEIGNELKDTLTPASKKGIVTDKLLANFLNTGVLAAAFPGARFVCMQRDYRAIALSIFAADLGRSAHPYAMNLEEIGRYTVAFDTLMTHWKSVLGARFIKVSYEKLVTRPTEEIPQLLKSLGLEPSEACLHPERSDRSINTMSVAQARKPISTGSVQAWRRFEDGLKPVSDILAENGLL